MFKFLKIASTVSLCGALMMIAPVSEASIVNYTFSGVTDFEPGLFSGVAYTGSFAYDDATLTNIVSELSLSSFTLNFMSTVFTLANQEFTSTADFQNGVFLGVNYTVNNFEPKFSFISASGSGLPEDVAYFSYAPTSGESGFGSLNYVAVSAVPVPAAIWLFTSVLAGFGAITRRKRQITL